MPALHFVSVRTTSASRNVTSPVFFTVNVYVTGVPAAAELTEAALVSVMPGVSGWPGGGIVTVVVPVRQSSSSSSTGTQTSATFVNDPVASTGMVATQV